jgi:hypothetical protein
VVKVPETKWAAPTIQSEAQGVDIR